MQQPRFYNIENHLLYIRPIRHFFQLIYTNTYSLYQQRHFFYNLVCIRHTFHLVLLLNPLLLFLYSRPFYS